jgi:hypothetical protein
MWYLALRSIRLMDYRGRDSYENQGSIDDHRHHPHAQHNAHEAGAVYATLVLDSPLLRSPLCYLCTTGFRLGPLLLADRSCWTGWHRLTHFGAKRKLTFIFSRRILGILDLFSVWSRLLGRGELERGSDFLESELPAVLEVEGGLRDSLLRVLFGWHFEWSLRNSLQLGLFHRLMLYWDSLAGLDSWLLLLELQLN